MGKVVLQQYGEFVLILVTPLSIVILTLKLMI